MNFGRNSPPFTKLETLYLFLAILGTLIVLHFLFPGPHK
jgi:hypothetical protein